MDGIPVFSPVPVPFGGIRISAFQTTFCGLDCRTPYSIELDLFGMDREIPVPFRFSSSSITNILERWIVDMPSLFDNERCIDQSV
jgi:hypothetical protein